MSASAKAEKRRKERQARVLAILSNPNALLPNGGCPACKAEFRGRLSCLHTHYDVQRANSEFLMQMMGLA